MIIKNEQQNIFKKNALKKFEDEMLEHLAKFSPLLYDEVKESQMRKVIRLGINLSGKYGFTFRGPVRLYLEMMILFGSFFDTDPQYRWITDVLKNTTIPQMQRAEQLYIQVCDYLEQADGQEDIDALKALKGIGAYRNMPITIFGNDFVNSIERNAFLIYPRKSEITDANARIALINEAIITAKKYGISTDQGNLLVPVLMFVFGHGCFEDPLYPWINDTISNDRSINSHLKAELLESKALTWLDRVLINFDKDGES